jgi:hypothetical protein
MSHLVNIGPYSLTVARLLVIAGTTQLSLFALISIVSRSPVPKRGMRNSERNLIVSTVLFASLWLAGFDARSLIHSFSATPHAEAAMVGRHSSGSCASIARDMAATQVQKRLGEPDERKSDEETRGPGATIWIYRDSRCAVHLFDNKVEFIE